MLQEVLQFSNRQERLDDGIQQKLAEVLAMLRAIDAGELFAALPECEVARSHHLTALTLLSLAEKQLSAIYIQISH